MKPIDALIEEKIRHRVHERETKNLGGVEPNPVTLHYQVEQELSAFVDHLVEAFYAPKAPVVKAKKKTHTRGLGPT